MSRPSRRLVDSGLSWIGQVPEHWEIVPTRSFLRLSSVVVGSQWDSTPLLSLTKEGLILRDIASGVGKYPASFDSYQLVEKDDLVFCLFDMDETPRTVALCTTRGMVTGAYTRFVVNQAVANSRFLTWYYISIDDGKRFKPLYSGLRKVIQKPRFLSAKAALPPLHEQRAIADFLDRETAKIDTLIAKQQGLVDLLKERRDSIVVRRAFGVTDGERPLPKFIGRHLAVEDLLKGIPSHWEIIRFKACLLRLDVRNADLAHSMLSLTNKGTVVPRDALRQEPDEANLPRYLVAQRGQLVLNPMWLTGGAIGVAGISGAVSPDYRVFETRGHHLGRYLHYVLRTPPYFDQYLLYTRAQTTFDRRVQQPVLDNLPLPVPPLPEQSAIADHLDRETSRINTLIAKAEHHMTLAKERRAALVTAAVTGQIDVAGEAS